MGRAKNFVADNRLYTLYPRVPSQKLFFSVPPPPWRQAAALFMGKLEGTIKANTIVLKFKAMSMDLVDGVKSQLAALVVPFGSPVPELKIFNLPYQSASWQLSRTFSRDGVSFPIVMEEAWSGTQRRIKGTFSRDLSNENARGTFTLKVDLCTNCPASWEGEE